MAKTMIIIEDVEKDGETALCVVADYGDLDPNAEPQPSHILAAGIVCLFRNETLWPLAEEQARLEIFEKEVRPVQAVPDVKDAA